MMHPGFLLPTPLSPFLGPWPSLFLKVNLSLFKTFNGSLLPSRGENLSSSKWCLKGRFHLPRLIPLHHMDTTTTPNDYHPECAQMHPLLRTPFLPNSHMFPRLISRTPLGNLLTWDPCSGLPCVHDCPPLVDSEHLHLRAWRFPHESRGPHRSWHMVNAWWNFLILASRPGALWGRCLTLFIPLCPQDPVQSS